jgi:hypothetical protein
VSSAETYSGTDLPLLADALDSPARVPDVGVDGTLVLDALATNCP